MIVNVLTIAGSDPSGGAGIQADLKAFSAHGAYGMGVLTALTAQNTQGVQGVHPIPPDVVAAQLSSVFSDIRVDAVKIGMLGDVATVEVVTDALRRWRPPFVVCDPVMVAKSGDRLLAPDAVAALRSELLPLVHLVTPNLPEAADLLDVTVAVDEAGMRAQVDALLKLGPGLLLKGGHLPGDVAVDLLSVHGELTRFATTRVPTRNTHGTGCALSSAIAALRPQRASWAEAVGEAKTWLTEALRHADSLDVGSGHGPPHHFHALWAPQPSTP
ncbi:MAG: bifunctional hydroxymethylpyrimidine kinase/phosphomethylpyrimidine kinase [Mycobacteriaceae bacterium]